MGNDFAVRFTEEVYANKDEVKKALSISNIDSIWDKINQYRSYYKKDLGLFGIERKPFSVCLSSSISNRIIALERKLTRLMISLERMSKEVRLDFLSESLFKTARSYADVNSLTIKDEELRAIIGNPLKDVPQAFISLKNYIATIQNYLYRSSNKYDLSILTSFYGKILRKEIDVNDSDSYLRMVELYNPYDHMMFGKHYSAAPLEKLPTLINDAMLFNNNGTVFSIVKAIVTYFYLIYIKPFDYFNEECALLSLKYILASNDIEAIPFILNLEKHLLNSEEEKHYKKFLLSELSGDLTYYLNYVIEMIEVETDSVIETLSASEIRQIKEEFTQADIVKNGNVSPQVLSNLSTPNNNPIVFEQKVSIPKLPTGLDQKDIDLIAENLLELYPSLKKLQARFYAGHCTIGKYYSIAQYKKETGVAYETARTSMDNLVNLGFYKKEQIKNKFVYTPVVR